MYFTNIKWSSFCFPLTFKESKEIAFGLSRKGAAMINKKAKLHNILKAFIVVFYHEKEAECSIYKVILTMKWGRLN